jgi:aminoacrylate hydrolase
LNKEVPVPFLSVNGAKLHYETDGSGEPLVLIMGLGGNSQVWAPVRRQLASRYQLIMYDMLGTGRSEESPFPSTRESLVQELDALLTHLDLRRVLGLGYSFGASVLLNYAAQKPERLRAISLVSGMYRITPYARAFFEVQSELAQMLPRSQYVREALLWLCSESFFERNPDFFERMTGMLQRSPRGAHVGWNGWKQFLNALDPDYADIIRSLSLPTQIVHGSADKLSSIDQVRRVASAASRLQLDVVPEGGHMLTWDAPEAMVAAVFDFFQKHDEPSHAPMAAASDTLS